MRKVNIEDQSPKKGVKRLGHRVELYDRGKKPDEITTKRKDFYMGKVFVSSSKITWCKGKTHRENGLDLRWRDFIAVIEMLGIEEDKTTGEIKPFDEERFRKRLRVHRKRHKKAHPEFYPNDTATTQSEAEGEEAPSDNLG